MGLYIKLCLGHFLLDGGYFVLTIYVITILRTVTMAIIYCVCIYDCRNWKDRRKYTSLQKKATRPLLVII